MKGKKRIVPHPVVGDAVGSEVDNAVLPGDAVEAGFGRIAAIKHIAAREGRNGADFGARRIDRQKIRRVRAQAGIQRIGTELQGLDNGQFVHIARVVWGKCCELLSRRMAVLPFPHLFEQGGRVAVADLVLFQEVLVPGVFVRVFGPLGEQRIERYIAQYPIGDDDEALRQQMLDGPHKFVVEVGGGLCIAPRPGVFVFVNVVAEGVHPGFERKILFDLHHLVVILFNDENEDAAIADEVFEEGFLGAEQFPLHFFDGDGGEVVFEVVVVGVVLLEQFDERGGLLLEVEDDATDA